MLRKMHGYSGDRNKTTKTLKWENSKLVVCVEKQRYLCFLSED